MDVSTARLADYAQLARPRIALMVLITVTFGAMLASVDRVPLAILIHALISTTMVTASASALNQYIERESDTLMRRTQNRPLPAGRLAPWEVLALGVALGAVGLAYQMLVLPPATAAVTAFTLLSYVFAYTPSKTRTTLNTLIGAVPGALPPVIGWTAVTGTIDRPALALFLVLFFWQVPHFLAIAWMYRDEYARAGHQMLPVTDTDGRLTARQMIVYLLALIPVTLLAGQALGASWGYAAGAIALGLYFLRPALAFRREPSVATARRVLRVSIVYLPALLALLLGAKYLSI
jgi:protoheme IX farnesyltransferase